MIVIIGTIPRHYCHSHSLQTHFFATLNFIQNIIIVSISHNNWMYMYGFFALILIQKLLVMSWTYLIVITSRCGLIIVRVGNMIFCFSVCYFQYKLVFPCMEQRYCALKTNSPADITCPSNFVLFCSVYASEMN